MIEINNTTQQKINSAQINFLVAEFLRFYKKANYQVSLAIVGESRMRFLNKQHRRLDKTTDVLSFPGQLLNNFHRPQSSLEPKYLGEIIINIQETKKPARYLEVLGVRRQPAYILAFLLVHGLLHLIGYDDATEAGRQRMIKLGKDFLNRDIFSRKF